MQHVAKRKKQGDFIRKRIMHERALQRASGATSHEIPTDILEILLESLALDEYNAFRIVCKTWHIFLLDPKWYRIVRRNTRLPITPKGRSHAMCKNGFGGIHLTRKFVPWSYGDNPWGHTPYREHYLMYWHVDVLNAINKYMTKGATTMFSASTPEMLDGGALNLRGFLDGWELRQTTSDGITLKGSTGTHTSKRGRSNRRYWTEYEKVFFRSSQLT